MHSQPAAATQLTDGTVGVATNATPNSTGAILTGVQSLSLSDSGSATLIPQSLTPAPATVVRSAAYPTQQVGVVDSVAPPPGIQQMGGSLSPALQQVGGAVPSGTVAGTLPGTAYSTPVVTASSSGSSLPPFSAAVPPPSMTAPVGLSQGAAPTLGGFPTPPKIDLMTSSS